MHDQHCVKYLWYILKQNTYFNLLRGCFNFSESCIWTYINSLFADTCPKLLSIRALTNRTISASSTGQSDSKFILALSRFSQSQSHSLRNNLILEIHMITVINEGDNVTTASAGYMFAGSETHVNRSNIVRSVTIQRSYLCHNKYSSNT